MVGAIPWLVGLRGWHDFPPASPDATPSFTAGEWGDRRVGSRVRQDGIPHPIPGGESVDGEFDAFYGGNIYIFIFYGINMPVYAGYTTMYVRRYRHESPLPELTVPCITILSLASFLCDSPRDASAPVMTTRDRMIRDPTP